MSRAIQILIYTGPPKTARHVKAYSFGPLAVNRSLDKSGIELRSWSVTHVPTGYAIVRGMRYKLAVEAAKALSKLDWPISKDPRVTIRRTDLRAEAAQWKAMRDIQAEV